MASETFHWTSDSIFFLTKMEENVFWRNNRSKEVLKYYVSALGGGGLSQNADMVTDTSLSK